MKIELEPDKIVSASRAFNYLDALYQDTKVIIESRRKTVMACCCGKYMALGLEIGAGLTEDQRIAEVTTGDWMKLSKLVECFGVNSCVNISAVFSGSSAIFSCDVNGWSLNVVAVLGGNPIRLPVDNLKAIIDLGMMAVALNNAVQKSGDESGKRHRLEFGYSLQKSPVVRILSCNEQEIATAIAESINPPTASGLSINPAHLHDGVVLLKKQMPEKLRAKVSDSPDQSSWVVQCCDRQDFLLVSRFR